MLLPPPPPPTMAKGFKDAKGATSSSEDREKDKDTLQYTVSSPREENQIDTNCPAQDNPQTNSSEVRNTGESDPFANLQSQNFNESDNLRFAGSFGKQKKKDREENIEELIQSSANRLTFQAKSSKSLSESPQMPSNSEVPEEPEFREENSRKLSEILKPGDTHSQVSQKSRPLAVGVHSLSTVSNTSCLNPSVEKVVPEEDFNNLLLTHEYYRKKLLQTRISELLIDIKRGLLTWLKVFKFSSFLDEIVDLYDNRNFDALTNKIEFTLLDESQRSDIM